VLVGLSFQAVKPVVDCRSSFSWPPDRSRVERVLCLPPLQNPNDWDLCEFLKIFLQLEHLEFSFFLLEISHLCLIWLFCRLWVASCYRS
jgi:hypothetical protein